MDYMELKRKIDLFIIYLEYRNTTHKKNCNISLKESLDDSIKIINRINLKLQEIKLNLKLKISE